MSRCSTAMTKARINRSHLSLTLLIIATLLATEIDGSSLSRRRSSFSNAKKASEDVTEASATVPDQIALATTDNQRRRGYNYGNYEINLIRPDTSEPRLHAKITAKYTSSISSERQAESPLEDSETAEEYVSKAVQRYGARLKEPIRIESEPEFEQEQNQNNLYRASTSSSKQPDFYEQPINVESSSEPQQRPELTQQQQQAQDEAISYLNTELQTQLQEQYQQYQQQLQAANSQEGQEQRNSEPLPSEASAPSQPIYDDEATADGTQPVDRNFRTKFSYPPVGSYHEQSNENEKIRVSASTEIPKAEIMKQIEKSVIRYMKELEAEGKIITAPKEPKTYYKVVTVPSEEKYVSSTTTRPKYYNSPSATTIYHGSYSSATSPSPLHYSSYTPSSSTTEKSVRYHSAPKSVHKQRIHSESSGHHRAHSSASESGENLGPNVEFVYKIKSRAPLQAATVKTISKPYSLQFKSSGEQFDHSSVLKNLEEFDLSHVITTQEPEEPSPSSGKAGKLYFNSDVHQDINSLPQKVEKTRQQSSEYHKVKETSSHPEYKGYSGYFAEPGPIEVDKEALRSNPDVDDGYPIMNPYQYVLKKEPLPTKFDSKGLYSQGPKGLEFDSYSPKFNHNPEGYGYQHSYQPAEREGDPIRVLHKHAQRHAPGKRGKRGGGVHPSNGNKKGVHRPLAKDIEASLALRPPPKV